MERKQIIRLTLTDEEKAKIVAAAEREGLKVAAFTRRAALLAADSANRD